MAEIVERQDSPWDDLNYQWHMQSRAWDDKRKKAIKKAQYRCRLCNRSERLCVHHRSYEDLRHERQSDLVALCKACHTLFHQNRTLAKSPK